MTEPTLTERELRVSVAASVRRLQATLGLSSLGVAALLRNPGDTYPSDGLVRTVLAETQNVSARFAGLVEVRLAEVETQLQAGVQVSTIAGPYQNTYLVQPKTHLITVIPEAELQEADYQHPDRLSTIVIASLAVPAEWIGTCPVCGRAFVRRSTRQMVCRRTDTRGRYPCVTEQARRRAGYRRERDRAEIAAFVRAKAHARGQE